MLPDLRLRENKSLLGSLGVQLTPRVCPSAHTFAVGLYAREHQHVIVPLCGCQGPISVCLCVSCSVCVPGLSVGDGSGGEGGWVNPFVSLSSAGGELSSCRLQLGNPSKGE